MAKKEQREIESVELKDPKHIIDLPKVGLYITKDNLTVDRYRHLVALSEEFKQYFNIKLITPPKDEVQTKK